MSDLISRQLLISKLANSTVKFATYDDWEHCCDVIESVEREKGEWLLNKESGIYECKNCGYVPSAEGFLYFNFCPNCGAEMRKGKKKDDRA